MQNDPTYISAVMIPTLFFTIGWFVIGLLLFGFLHWMFKAQRQRFWRKDMKTDLVYWFLAPLLYGYMVLIARRYAVDYAHVDRVVSDATNSLARMPILAQVAIILILTDLLQYWVHRLFHRYPLWRFHSIHHAPVNVDWLTSVRMHPVNFILYSTLINFLISFLAFRREAFIFLVPFNLVAALLAHANLNWTFGPFRYVVASPVFHRWHHTYPDEGGNKNFAPNFPFLDLAFGTFYMPKGQLPCVFGTPGDNVPTHFWGQLSYPFKRQAPLAAWQRDSQRRTDPDVINAAAADMHVAAPNPLHSNNEAD
jgi:sterol desaturase/sphingolipid hydroxylase (fatty acid hydroxylase superfamily)